MLKVLTIFIITGFAAVTASAGEKGVSKSVEVVSDTVNTAVNKTGALLCGNLEFTMSEDGDKYKHDDDYTINAIGEKVPASTRRKTWKKI